MNNYITFNAMSSTLKTASKKLCAVAFVSIFTFAVHAQIINGSFEDGFTGWDTTAGDYIIGHNSWEPIGTDGYLSADLGGGDIAGAVLSQTISNFAPGSVYRLAYDSACNPGNSQIIDTTWAVLISADGQTVINQTFSQQNVGSLAGSFGFQHRELDFSIPLVAQHITVSFLDETPNGGIGVDTALDSVSVIAVPEPSVFGLAAFGAFILLFRRR